jgi:cytochrome c biogenesis protein CcdA
MPEGPLAVYLALGMVATVNPCGFAMLPAYLSYFLGLEGADDESPTAGFGEALRVAGAVSAGFLAVFAVAGTIVRTVDARFVYENVPWVSIVIGLALLALGVAMLGGFELVTRLPKLDRGGRSRTVGSMFVFGVSYAVASIGCTLPLFLSAVAGTIETQSLLDGVVVFLIYGLGMTVVLTALTVAIALARTSIVRFLRRSQQYVGRVAGGLVALAGGYVAYYGWLELRSFRRPGAVPESGITDTVTGWSYDLTDWVNDVGAVRLAVALAAVLVAVGAVLRLRRRPPALADGK